MYEDDPWLGQYIDVPEILGRALGIQRARSTRLTVLSSLVEALGLPDRAYTWDTWEIINALVDPLIRALEEGPRLLDPRPLMIAKQAVSDIASGSLLPAMTQLGWGSTQIHERIRVNELESYLRDAMGRQLGNRLDRTMRRWEQGGVYGARWAS